MDMLAPQDGIMPAREAQAAGRQFVTLSVGGQAYAVDIAAVRDFRSWSPLTALPGAPHGACGVLDIRGDIVEVFDLSMLLGGPATVARAGHVVLVVALGDVTVGILVDAVSDIILVNPGELRPSPGTGRAEGRAARMIEGLIRQGDRLVAVLDLTALLDRGARH